MIVNGLTDLLPFQGKFIGMFGPDGWSAYPGYLDREVSTVDSMTTLRFRPIIHRDAQASENVLICLNDRELQNRNMEVLELTSDELLDFKESFEEGLCSLVGMSVEQGLQLLKQSIQAIGSNKGLI